VQDLIEMLLFLLEDLLRLLPYVLEVLLSHVTEHALRVIPVCIADMTFMFLVLIAGTPF
jgi:hypothetical protein